MQDMIFSTAPGARRGRSGSGRGLATLLALLVLIALGGAAWYGWQSGWLRRLGDSAVPATPTSASPTATALVAQGNLIATSAALADATARLSALQQRLAELNQQAAAASGQATRAEALLVAFAVRRAVERGQPLGYLETAMRVRFGESQPTAVDQIAGAAQKPVTAGGLAEEFMQIEPRLIGGPANEGTWDWMSRQFGGLFILRHDDMPSPAPESRVARARAALAGQRVELAIAEVERLPGKEVAVDWLAHAREWVATQRALDQLESAALSVPAPSPPAPASITQPVAAPSPAATATPAK